MHFSPVTEASFLGCACSCLLFLSLLLSFFPRTFLLHKLLLHTFSHLPFPNTNTFVVHQNSTTLNHCEKKVAFLLCCTGTITRSLIQKHSNCGCIREKKKQLHMSPIFFYYFSVKSRSWLSKPITFPKVPKAFGCDVQKLLFCRHTEKCHWVESVAS